MMLAREIKESIIQSSVLEPFQLVKWLNDGSKTSCLGLKYFGGTFLPPSWNMIPLVVHSLAVGVGTLSALILWINV